MKTQIHCHLVQSAAGQNTDENNVGFPELNLAIYTNWLPGLDSNQQPSGYEYPLCFHKARTISLPRKDSSSPG